MSRMFVMAQCIRQRRREVKTLLAGLGKMRELVSRQSHPGPEIIGSGCAGENFCKTAGDGYFAAMFRNDESDAGVRAVEPGGKARLKLHDKQSERDYRELRIDKDGVRGMRFPIQVRDKARSLQNTIATIGMYVDLPKEFKGTHMRSEEHTSELQSQSNIVCRLLLEKK